MDVVERKRSTLIFGVILILGVVAYFAYPKIKLSFFDSLAGDSSQPLILYGQAFADSLSTEELARPEVQADLLKDIGADFDRSWDISEFRLVPQTLPSFFPERIALLWQQFVKGPAGTEAPVEDAFVSVVINQSGANDDVLSDSYIAYIKPQEPILSPADALAKIVLPIYGVASVPELMYHSSLNLSQLKLEEPLPEPDPDTTARAKNKNLTASAKLAQETGTESQPPSEVPVIEPTEPITTESSGEGTTEAEPVAPTEVEPIILPDPDPKPDEPRVPIILPPSKLDARIPASYKLVYRIEIGNEITPFISNGTTMTETGGRPRGLTTTGETYCKADSECLVEGTRCIDFACQAPKLQGGTCDISKTNHDCDESVGLICSSVKNTCEQPLTLSECKVDNDCNSSLKPGTKYCGEDNMCHNKDTDLGPTKLLGAGTGLMFTGSCKFVYFPFPSHVDPTVNFASSWGRYGPLGAEGCGKSLPTDPGYDHFLTWWTGKIEPKMTGMHKFYSYFDTEGSVKLGYDLIIDGPGSQTSKEIFLEAGSWYDITVSMHETTLDAAAILSWSTATMPKEVIPMSQLYNYDAMPPSISSPADISVTEGLVADFKARVYEGTLPVTCQWRKDGKDITGETNCMQYKINETSVSDTGIYDMVAKNAFGTATSKGAVLTVLPIPGGAGTGLRGVYFGGTTLEQDHAVETRDSNVDFDWGLTGPAIPYCTFDGGEQLCSLTKKQNDNLSTRWYGQLYTPIAGVYLFTIDSNNGARLWVDGNLEIDNWYIPDEWALSTTPITLTVGKHDIRFEYWEGEDTAKAKLSWYAVYGYGRETLHGIIPAKFLFPLDFHPIPANVEIGEVIYIDAITGEIVDRFSSIRD